MQTIATDRRASSRFDIPGRIIFGDGQSGKLLDLSEGGVSFEFNSAQAVSVGSTIRLSVETDLGNFYGSAVVLRSILRPSGACLAACEFSNSNRRDILKVILRSVLKGLSGKVKSKDRRGFVYKFSRDLRKYIAGLKQLCINPAYDSADLLKLSSSTDHIVLLGEQLKNNTQDKLLMDDVKRYFRAVVAPWAYKSLIVKRSYDKPKGYPGDFQTLEIIYNQSPISANDKIGHLYDQYFLANPYADAVRDRKNFMKHKLSVFLKDRDYIRILNLASGSAREIFELFQEFPILKQKKIEFVLYDWDSEALEFSCSRLKCLPENIKITPLKEDILTYGKSTDFFKKRGYFDLIYSIGLSDYLPDRLNKRIISNSFEGLSPGGEFIFAHKDKEVNFSHLPPEWFCDWVFIPRDKQEVLDLFSVVRESMTFSGLEFERGLSRDIFYVCIKKSGRAQINLDFMATRGVGARVS